VLSIKRPDLGDRKADEVVQNVRGTTIGENHGGRNDTLAMLVWLGRIPIAVGDGLLLLDVVYLSGAPFFPVEMLPLERIAP
jgi:hypothetical protein